MQRFMEDQTNFEVAVGVVQRRERREIAKVLLLDKLNIIASTYYSQLFFASSTATITFITQTRSS